MYQGWRNRYILYLYPEKHIPKQKLIKNVISASVVRMEERKKKKNKKKTYPRIKKASEADFSNLSATHDT